MTSGTLHVEDHIADRAKIYFAPEAATGGDEGAARADVLSLGAIAYHILTGRLPSAIRSICRVGCARATGSFSPVP